MRSSKSGLLLGLAASLGCGGANVGDRVRPSDYTAGGALGVDVPACTGAPKPARPLVIDLDADTRVDLEASMKKGVVVVAYDCKTIRVLPNCRLENGVYDYAGVSRKEQTLKLDSRDELAVNLPLSAGKLGAEVTSGRSIDIGLVLVGRRSTTASNVTMKALTGACEGATHYLQTSSVGAFAMTTGSAGKVVAVADLFKVGASGSSSATRSASTHDGSLEACRKSDPDAPSPPAECRAPVRVELHPIATEAAPAAGGDDKRPAGHRATAVVNPCPDGYQLSEGVCTKTAGAYLCDPKNAAECKEQCEKGSADSCFNYGSSLEKAAESAPLDEKIRASNEAGPFYAKACDGESANGCAWHARAIAPIDPKKDVPKLKEAVAIAKRSCDLGSAEGCYFWGTYLSDEDVKAVHDPVAARKAMERGCALGDGIACADAAAYYIRGDHVARDPNRAVELLVRACSGGDSTQCGSLAEIYATGAFGGAGGFVKDPERAAQAARDACRLDPIECSDAVKWALKAGKEQDAFGLAKAGCDAGRRDACVLLGDLHAAGRGTPKAPDRARELWTAACEKGSEAACKRLGSAPSMAPRK